MSSDFLYLYNVIKSAYRIIKLAYAGLNTLEAKEIPILSLATYGILSVEFGDEKLKRILK